ncbi:MAG: transporter substrate-binding domain-containing protein [Bryobacterales bacterium]|nr:transporter substrate-binding domain-containing protein [Bryobacterales bacterium]
MRWTDEGLKLGMAALLCMLAAGACGERARQQSSPESVIETIKKRGALKVGMSTFVPWAMRDKTGELVGFEIDVARKLATDMGVAVDFVPTAWDGIIPALLAGKFDVIIGGLSITAQRNLTVNFTVPYAHSGMGVAANSELSRGLTWPEDYDSTEVTFTCRRGATSCSAVEELFSKAAVRKFDDEPQAVQEVLNGNAHAFVSSYPKPTLLVHRYGDKLFLPTMEALTQGNEAFGLRKGDPDALNFFSNWILVNTSNGWLKERHSYWFKTTSWAGQVDLTESAGQ